MPDVYIIGNSGAARECYWILRDVQTSSPALDTYYNFSGFLDWKGYEGELHELEHLHIGTSDQHEIDPQALYVIGIGDTYLRKAVFEEYRDRGAHFMNLIHPWSYVCPSANMGEGNIIQRGCTIYTNANLGDANYLNGAVNLSHDAVVGDFNFFGPYALVLGGAEVGSCNHIGPHGVILEHSHMRDGNLLCPGSVLYKGCSCNCRMAGNPALKIGEYNHAGE